MDEKSRKKLLEINSKFLIIYIAVMLVSIILFGFAISLGNTKGDKNSAVYYSDLIADGKDAKSVTYTKIDVAYVQGIASKGDLDYYFVGDEEGYVYIVRMTERTYDKMEAEWTRNPENFSYEFYGWTHKTSSELKDYIIDNSDDFFDELTITNLNFNSYFSSTYLDETQGKSDVLSVVLIIVAVIGFIGGAIGLGICLVSDAATKKTLKKYDKNEIDEQLSRADVLEYPKENIYLTEKYIVSKVNGLHIYQYSDLYWIYKETRRVNGIRIGVLVQARLIDKKLVTLAACVSNEKIIDAIGHELINRNSAVLFGFTEENKQKFKEYKKNN